MVRFDLEDSLINSNLIRNSIYYALYDRLNYDHFSNLFEINLRFKSRKNVDELVDYIRKIFSLKEPLNQDVAFSYSFPKSTFFQRRCVYLPFKELVLRYHLINSLSLEIESAFIKTSFANRSQHTKKGFINLFPDYYSQYLNFVIWTKNVVNKVSSSHSKCYVLKADITAFYDTVSHDYLVRSIYSITCGILPQKYEPLLFDILQPIAEYYSYANGALGSEKVSQGLLVGNRTEGYFANILLSKIDELMISKGFKYTRYVDDIRVVSPSKADLIEAVHILQDELLRLGLNLNSAKTEIVSEPKLIEELLRPDNEAGDYFVDEIYSEKLFNEEMEYSKDYLNKIDFSGNFNTDDEINDIKKIISYLSELGPNDDYDSDIVVKAISCLPKIIKLNPRYIKRATWYIVKFAVFGFPNQVMLAAYRAMNTIFIDQDIMNYSRTRLIHHLIKPRKKDPPYLAMITKGSNSKSQILQEIFERCLSEKSIDLQLNALYAIWGLSSLNNGSDIDQIEFQDRISDYLPRPISYTLTRALALIVKPSIDIDFFPDFNIDDFVISGEGIGAEEIG
ncbi:RNA-directed DNA polymerase [Nostocaceae cyanobacterium CENA369]|uniref:RNA-directed DNA polymerase n=1 Tax=Dendronalium phyllosphericum CENA369 TaxID=1725256 RepID=A0A8J7I8F4_9NOST|nr:RNA-directed DNA polymerase [Dendronalium phyllosphericum]MBH8575061.1 RNA-directed DNA polymerase [Dendronalium phyllosphericum CENA369]